MPINPLDPEKNWPDKRYGPSNFYKRSKETRSQESAQKTPKGLKLREMVVWDAMRLYKEQVKKALSAKEYSPDSIVGLADLITEVLDNATGKEAAIKQIKNNQEMLLWALRLYDKVPESYKRDPVKGHPSLIQGNYTGEVTIQSLEKNGFKFEKEDADGRHDRDKTYDIQCVWEDAARIFRVVAMYLDETTRN